MILALLWAWVGTGSVAKEIRDHANMFRDYL